ncbi:hypothetical protein LEP3755_25780 [Leptolyngbya sp. NIES-3755]|nr:hypothetical protein LEP3755_25780 [Leptolyngbya sp. NIES-3755]
MRVLQFVFGILSSVGYVGNGILFFYIEWTFLRQNFIQILNPLLHLQVLSVLLTTPLFWAFLAMSFLGVFATASIESYLKQRSRQVERNAEPKAKQAIHQETRYVDIPTQKSSKTQAPTSTNATVDDITPQTGERPFIRCLTDELEEIAGTGWNNAKVLNQLHHELSFRSKNKSRVLKERISNRLAELQSTQITWSTTANPGVQNLSTDAFKYEEGLLRRYGYKVGKDGLPESERREILDKVFLLPLLQIDNSAYSSEWGEPKSEKRLKKLAESIAAFTRNAKRRTTGDFSIAIQDWEDDLEYLKKMHYDNRFSFQYPLTN